MWSFLHCFSMVLNGIQGLSYLFYSCHWHQRNDWFCPLADTQSHQSSRGHWGLQPQISSPSIWSHPWSAHYRQSSQLLSSIHILLSFTTPHAFLFLLFFFFNGGVISERRRGQKDLYSAISKSEVCYSPFLTTSDIENVGAFSQLWVDYRLSPEVSFVIRLSGSWNAFSFRNQVINGSWQPRPTFSIGCLAGYIVLIALFWLHRTTIYLFLWENEFHVLASRI